jgi:hypothetical protein
MLELQQILTTYKDRESAANLQSQDQNDDDNPVVFVSSPLLPLVGSAVASSFLRPINEDRPYFPY